MIDRVARKQLASCLRQLLARQVTNDEFECSLPRCQSGDGVEWERQGDIAVWPFLTSSEFTAACAQPRFLVGSS